MPPNPSFAEGETSKCLGLHDQNLISFLPSFPSTENYSEANHLKLRLHSFMGSFNGDMISSWSTETAEAPIVGGRYTTRAEEPHKILSLVQLESFSRAMIVV